MTASSQHTFHIPVLGLSYSIDSPVKVARFGISSVISIVQDDLIEQMRQLHSEKVNEPYILIPKTDIDHRAKRITAYLNLMNTIVNKQIEAMKQESFDAGSELIKYFEMLPENAPAKIEYRKMLVTEGIAKKYYQNELRKKIIAGAIDVNIMTKIDNLNYSPDNGEPLPAEYSDAMSALRGFANSTLNSAIVFSAGLNPRLFSYLETFSNFLPDHLGFMKKKIILKVSDYRSALVQGKYLAKKGLWISEFRIESGLNCGGHAFPTEGYLLGPILEEFKQKKQELATELFGLYKAALAFKNIPLLLFKPEFRITVQGGIGTASEDAFLRSYYPINGTGWGSPFLLVPDATCVDEITLQKLANAKQDDYYLSHASPLGVPFNNFRSSTSESQRKLRIEKNRPGSPCYKKYLAFNTEFTQKPICQASRQYQRLKLKELDTLNLRVEEYKIKHTEIVEKDCLCEGLSSSALIKNEMPVPHHLNAVTICPGPNLAYFSGIFSLEEIVSHIYGRINILNSLSRSHMFVNELKMYIDYLKEEVKKNSKVFSEKQARYLSGFKANLLDGIEYYLNLVPNMPHEAAHLKQRMTEEMIRMKNNLSAMFIQKSSVV
ncbi:MAG: hypothetical protein H7296_05060 [Bacteroidia bacterium]|nr:hypothetical protein [Bacteroidia bacterium]